MLLARLFNLLRELPWFPQIMGLLDGLQILDILFNKYNLSVLDADNAILSNFQFSQGSMSEQMSQ